MGAAKKYNAGTIFLQVVPVFGDVQRTIKGKADEIGKALGDDLEKSSEKAGERAGKALGEGLEKSTKESAKKVGKAFEDDFGKHINGFVRSAQKQLDGINLETASEKTLKDLDRVKDKLRSLKDVDVTADFDEKKLRGQVEVAMATIDKIVKKAGPDLKVGHNLLKVQSEFEAIVKFMDATAAKQREFKFGVDVDDKPLKQLDRAMGSFEKKFRDTARRAADSLGDSFNPEIAKVKRRLDELADTEIGIDMTSAAAMAEIQRLEARLSELSGSEADPGIDIDIASALSKIGVVTAAVRALDGKDVDVQVDVDTGSAVVRLTMLQALMAAFRPRAMGMASASENSANAFRSFNFVILGAVTLLPALIPMIGALGGGLLALIPILGSVGAGLGVMMLGFSGIGDAVSAMGKVSDEAKTAAKGTDSAAKKMEGATNRVADAQRNLRRATQDASEANADAQRNLKRVTQDAAQANADAARQVADARRSAADSIQQALERQRDAARDYRDSVADVRDAEEDLREARKRAAEEIANREDNSRQLALDERQGVVDLFNATVNNNATQADGAATNLEKEQSAIDLEQARLRLEDIRREQRENAEQAKKDAKLGVNGTDTVKAAQERLTDAIMAQRDAHRAVGEAAKAVDRARVDGAREVAEAIREQNRTQQDGALAVADAVRTRDRAEQDGARSLADARRALAEAQRGYKDAVVETGEEGSAAVKKLETAMDKLGPAGKKFARFLFGLRAGFYELRDGVQAAMLPGVQAGLEAIIRTYGPKFQSFAERMGSVIGGLFRKAGRGLGREPWREFFATYSKLAPKLLRQFGKTTGNWMGVYVRLFTIVAPYAERLSQALLELSENALKFMESKKGAEFWEKFLDYAFKVGPMVADFFWELVKASINIGQALAPWGGMILKILDGILGFIADMDPKTLGFLLTIVMGLAIAFQLAVGAVALFAAGAAVFATPVAAIVFGVVAAGIALLALYHRFETVRKIINIFAKAVGKVLGFLWDKILKPIFKAWLWAWTQVGKFAVKYLTFAMGISQKVFKGIKKLWDSVLEPVWDAFIKVVKFLWDKVVKPIFGWIGDKFKQLGKFFRAYWNGFLFPIFDLFIKIVQKLWSKVIKPIFGWIGKQFKILGLALRDAWRTYIKPIFDAFMDTVGDKLVSKFRSAVSAIGKAWNDLKAKMAAPVKWVIDTVLNKGLIAAFNKVARFVGSKEMSTISWAANTSSGNNLSSNPGGNKNVTDAGYATGGVLPGYTPGRDVHHFRSPTAGNLHLSGGEAIMRPEFTAAVGTSFVDRANAAARRGGIDAVRKLLGGNDQRYAKGGVYFPVRGGYVNRSAYNLGHDGMDINHPNDASGRVPYVSATSGVVSSTGYSRGYGNAVFVRSPYGELVYGHSFDGTVQVKPGQTVRAGQWLANIGDTGNSQGAHLHFGFPGGTFQQAEALLGGSLQPGKISGDTGPSLPGWVSKIFGKPLEWIKGVYSKSVDALTDKFGDNGYISGLIGMGKQLLSPLADKIMGLLGKVGGDKGQAPETVATGTVQQMVQGVAQAYGWANGAQWNALSEIVSRESGWNPSAANPSSSARGLFQKMTSIHGALESSVAGQARWGLNYIKSRYGSPTDALAFHNSHGYYKDGGVLPGGDAGVGPSGGGGLPDNGTMMYDSGGYLPPGLTTVVNLTGKPEPVFTNDQWGKMQSGTGGEGGSFTYAPTFNKSDLTAADVADDLDFEFRKIRRSGAYGGSRPS